MKYTIGNLFLNVEEQGTGEPALVFLHYWGGSLRTWNMVVGKLKGSFRCVTYDMRGWGKSDAPASGYSISDLAAETVALIAALGLKKYVLVGHSMGGKVAQLFASRNPVGLAGLVLVAPAPPTPVHFPEEIRQQQLHAYDNRETVLQAIGFLTSHPPSSDITEQIIEDSLGGSREAVLAWPTSSLLEDISAELPKIAMPTLILAGEEDRLDSIEQHRKEVLARIANSRLQIIFGSGHLVPIDEPEQLAEAIAQFVGELPQ